MDKTIYFIRHGQTEFNKLGIVQGGGVDSSLNEKGKEQAQAFFDFYKNIPFDLVLTSALKRTHETVQAFTAKGIPWEQDARINEMNWGVHEGKKSEPWMHQAYKEMIENWKQGNFDARLEDGESAQELATRVGDFLEELKSKKAKQVLVCSHGRTMRCLMSLVKGEHLREMEKYNHKNTCLFIVQVKNKEFEVELENDIRHLEVLKNK